MPISITPFKPSVGSTVYRILRPYKRFIFSAADAVAIFLSLYFAFLLRFDGRLPIEYQDRFLTYGLIVIIINILFLSQQKMYSFSWDFVSLFDLSRLFKAITYANILFGLIVFIGRENSKLFIGFPRSIVFINYVLNLIFIGFLRIGKRLWQETLRKEKFLGSEKTLIVGAGAEGEQFLRNLGRHAYNIHYPVGIVDHRPEKKNSSIHGVRVLGTIEDIPSLIDEHEVEHLIIALASAEAKIIQQAVAAARDANIKNVKIIPDTFELLSGRLQLNDIREVRIDDLLGRTPANIDTERISQFVQNKIVLVTGAAGSIGSELCRQIMNFGPKTLIALDFNESGLFDLSQELDVLWPGTDMRFIIANIVDRDKIFRIMETQKPQVVFHAAAYKHVPFMEDFPEEAMRVNIFGTLHVAESAFKNGVETFVLISTDKAIRPISIMGKTKRAAEIIIQSMNAPRRMRGIAVRFGNVIGSRGSVIPLFQEKIRRRQPITITHPEMKRYFMTIPEASLLVTEAGAIGRGGEVFMLDMGQPIKIVDLARQLISLSGLQPDIDIPIVFTEPRPGEKLYEEIISDEERRIGATQWDKIFITKSDRNFRYDTVNHELQRLEKALTSSAPPEALKSFLDSFIYMSAVSS